MKPQRPKTRAVAFITEDGFLDLAQFPIDSVLKQAISDDPRRFYNGVTTLRCMWNSGREEAGVFLIGLLVACGDDWERRRETVHALSDEQTEACVKLLFGELKQVKSTNSTRRYLKEVVNQLAGMPPSLVLSGFQELADDRSFTRRMRDVFLDVLDGLDERQRLGF